MSWTAIRSLYVSATGNATTIDTRMRGMTITAINAALSRLTMRDGGATGTVRFDQDLPISTGSLINIRIPDAGIRFENGIHVSCPTSVTLSIYVD